VAAVLDLYLNDALRDNTENIRLPKTYLKGERILSRDKVQISQCP
jgi:hypothetical protein